MGVLPFSSWCNGGSVLVAGNRGIGSETGAEPVSLVLLTVNADDLVVAAEAVKEVIKIMARKKMLMKMKRVIKNIL